jgi:hypothetical protein
MSNHREGLAGLASSWSNEDHKAILEVRERILIMEERQRAIMGMLEQSLSRYADLHNRVTMLETLRHKLWGIVAVIGFLFTIAWELLKSRMK